MNSKLLSALVRRGVLRIRGKKTPFRKGDGGGFRESGEIHPDPLVGPQLNLWCRGYLRRGPSFSTTLVFLPYGRGSRALTILRQPICGESIRNKHIDPFPF